MLPSGPLLAMGREGGRAVASVRQEGQRDVRCLPEDGAEGSAGTVPFTDGGPWALGSPGLSCGQLWPPVMRGVPPLVISGAPASLGNVGRGRDLARALAVPPAKGRPRGRTPLPTPQPGLHQPRQTPAWPTLASQERRGEGGVGPPRGPPCPLVRQHCGAGPGPRVCRPLRRLGCVPRGDAVEQEQGAAPGPRRPLPHSRSRGWWSARSPTLTFKRQGLHGTPRLGGGHSPRPAWHQPAAPGTGPATCGRGRRAVAALRLTGPTGKTAVAHVARAHACVNTDRGTEVPPAPLPGGCLRRSPQS